MRTQTSTLAAFALLAVGCSSSTSQRPAATPETELYPESTYTPPTDEVPASSTIPDKRTQAGSDAPQDAANPAMKAPLDQGGDPRDVHISRAVREAIAADDELSFAAQNVDIITDAGHVTLRGAVRDAAESAAVERCARSTAGVREVHNLLVVSP